jgi:hypothetical protein
MTYAEAIMVVTEQAGSGKHAVVYALPREGWNWMSAAEYDADPAKKVHPFALAHDSRRTTDENRNLYLTACAWQENQ